MASLWQIFVRGASSPPTISEFLQLLRTNIQRIVSLTSDESHTEEPLNPYQCRSMSSKLVRTLENIEGRFNLCGEDSSSAFPETSTLPAVAFENFYLISERARELVERCCSVDWCQASTFQIHNEEAFKNVLLETSLCYNTFYGLVDDKTQYEDLRQTSTFEPPTSAEVMHDRMELLQRYQNFLDNSESSDTLIQKQHLAKHLLRRLSSMTPQSNIEDFDVCDLSLWPDGKSSDDEWGKNSVFLGSNVYKTTWLDVPCAKKMFDDGVQEEAILAEARILARLNHPNIVKFICWGHDTDTSWCPFIAMEQMERGLHSVIKKQAQFKRGPPFPLLSALDIMLQIAYGTCYLHENGIAHRDLKTSNVVVRQITTLHLQDYLQVKLVDFGLSKVKLSASRSNTISRPKTGTTIYMAPEVFQSGRANWFKADAYSFGIICSVILSGKEPFPSAEFPRSKLYEAICNGRRPMLPSETPRELTRLITECWDTNRNVRPDFVDICTRLAKMRHELLRDQHGLDNETDDSAESYIQEIFKEQSSARNQERSCAQWQLLENVGEEDEWFVPDQEFDIQIQHEVPNTTADHSSKSSSDFEAPERQRYAVKHRLDSYSRSLTPERLPSCSPLYPQSLTPQRQPQEPNWAPSYSRSLTPQRQPALALTNQRDRTNSIAQRQQTNSMALDWTVKESNTRSTNQGRVPSVHVKDRIPVSLFQDADSDYDKPWKAEEAGSCRDEDVYGEEILLWPRTNVLRVHHVDFDHQQYIMPGQERHEPGDLIGLKRQLVQLLNQDGGKMTLRVVPAEYNKLFGRPLYLAEYNAQKLVHLIDEMKDTMVIKGDGWSRTLHLVKKNPDQMTGKNMSFHDCGASASQGGKKKITVEGSYHLTGRIPNGGKSGTNMGDTELVREAVDVQRTNLEIFKRQLQELLVVYSNQIPYCDLMTAYHRRFHRFLVVESFGVKSLKALVEEVKDIAVLKEKYEHGLKKYYLMAV